MSTIQITLVREFEEARVLTCLEAYAKKRQKSIQEEVQVLDVISGHGHLINSVLGVCKTVHA